MAAPNESIAAANTVSGAISPAWATRVGPSRSPVSAPFLKSK